MGIVARKKNAAAKVLKTLEYTKIIGLLVEKADSGPGKKLCEELLPMVDIERVVSDIRKVFWGKKPSSWQDKTIAVENFIRVLATFGILASRNPTTAGGAKLKAASYGVAAVTNLLDFLLRTERAIEERMLD